MRGRIDHRSYLFLMPEPALTIPSGGYGSIIYADDTRWNGNFISLLIVNKLHNHTKHLVTGKLKYSEENLIAALKRNERVAFEYLYDHYSGALFNIISKTVKDEERSGDVLQESFVKIWKNIASYNPDKGRLFTWLMNIARNTAIDAVRMEGRKPVMNDILDPVAQSEPDVSDYHQTGTSELKAVIELLKPERKVLIDMAYFQGFTHEEISAQLNIPLGTVKSRIRTAIQELKQYFEV